MQKTRLLSLVTGLALLIAAVLSVTVAGAAAPADQSGAVTFSTPEAAIQTFFDGIAAGDFNKILQACAITEVSQNFQFDREIDRLRAFIPLQEYAPTTHPLYVEINQAMIVSRIASQVKLLTYSLLAGTDLDYSRVTVMEIDAAVSFMNAVDPARLATLEVRAIGLPNKAIMDTARYHENAVKAANVYSADDSTERVALFSFEGDFYMLGFTLLRYGESWKIISVSSPIGNTTALGLPVKMTAAEFAAMTQ